METSRPVAVDRPARGRRQRTSHAELERVAFGLFAEKGFDQTTIDDIAEAAGIGRRTFFNYYASKNDLVWGRFEHDVARLRRLLAAAPPDIAAHGRAARRRWSSSTPTTRRSCPSTAPGCA